MKADINGSAVMALAGIAGLAALAFMVWKKGGVKPAAAAVVGAASEAAAGVVVGMGTAVGVPETNSSKCAEHLAAGRLWEASFACPAGDFVGALFMGGPSKNDGGPVDQSIADRWDAYAKGSQRSATGSGSFDKWAAMYEGPVGRALDNGTGFDADYVAP